MTEEEELKFITNRKGNENIIDQNSYTYIRSKSIPTKDRIYWICSGKRSYSCPASVVTTLTSKKLVTRGAAEHNHGSRYLEMKVRAIENEKIQAAAKMPTVPPRTVVGMLTISKIIFL
jgi:hypothetical protein